LADPRGRIFPFFFRFLEKVQKRTQALTETYAFTHEIEEIMRLEKKDIEKLDRNYRLNLINSVPGVKPANLVGTRSLNKEDNLAIISSVVHLSSNPAHLGLVMRPPGKRPKDTYVNILETGSYTINHVPEDIYKQAHYTSAKLERELSEFDVMNIEREFLEGFSCTLCPEKPGQNRDEAP
jgi:hypothetical protein